VNKRSKEISGFAIGMLVVIALIHFIDAPSDFQDATYKGILFLLNGLGALVAVIGIYRQERNWGWLLGILVAGGALVMYVVSRTVGLPIVGVESEWFEPLGVLSVITEGLYLIASYVFLVRR